MDPTDDDLEGSGDGSGEDEAPARPAARPEGVRIIGAEEAAEAVARGDAARRRERGERGYGDRPEPPEGDDDRPVLRFPTQAESGDPSVFGAVPVVRADDPPPDESAPVLGEVPPIASRSGVDISLGGDESFELPHYSDPPTGQVPRVVIAEGDEQSESWSGLSSQPRWRDEAAPFADDDFSDLVDSGPRLGALERQSAEEFFGDELDATTSGYSGSAEVVPETRRAAARTAVRRTPGPPGGSGGGGMDRSSSAGRNLPAAIAVGVGLLAVGILCFKLGAIWTTLLVAVVLGLCTVELLSTLRVAGYNPATLLAIVAVPAFAIAPLADPSFGYPIVIGLTVISSLIWFLWVHKGPGAVGNLGVTLLSIFWIGGLGSFATLILGLGRLDEDARHLTSNRGIGIIWAVVLVTVCYDVGAYAIGRMFGRSPLSAASPSKTWEGLVGGIVAGLVIPVLILKGGGVAPLGDKWDHALLFCAFCAVMAPAGDLCESALKRDLDVKDMGDLLPGHGGVLDRFDGFLFVLPTAWFMVHLLKIPPF